MRNPFKKKLPVDLAKDKEDADKAIVREAVLLASRMNELTALLPRSHRFWFDFDQKPPLVHVTTGGWEQRRKVTIDDA